MYTTLIYITLILSLGLVIYTQHIWRNPELPLHNRHYLSLSAIFTIAELLTQAACLLLEFHPEYSRLYFAVVVVSIIVSTGIVPLQLIGLGFKKAGRIACVFAGIYSVMITAVSFTGDLFYISAEGVYTVGKLSFLLTIMYIVFELASLMLLIGLGRKFRYQKPITLILIAVFELFSNIAGIMSGFDVVRLLGLALAFILIYSYYENASMQAMYDALVESNTKNKNMSLQIVRALVSAVDAKDKYTNGHSRRVADYSVLLAEKLGWDADRLYQLKYEALMHDVGKIGIPDSVLNKPGRLTDAEFDIIKSHTVFGADILDGMDELPGAYQVARWHHERYDGRGYPDGLSGKDIPEISRIISIADTFDAMNSDRIYRRALPKDVIIRELEKGRGTQFDPDFVDVFIELYKCGAADEIAAAGRRDMQNQPEDAFREELRDFFSLFYDVRDMRGYWDDDYQQAKRMRSYLTRMAENYQAEIEIALVTVKAVKDAVLTDEELDSALEVLQKSIEDTVANLVVIGRVSKTQILTIRRLHPGPSLAEYIRLTFVYYYKIFNTEKLDLSFELLCEPTKTE